MNVMREELRMADAVRSWRGFWRAGIPGGLTRHPMAAALAGIVLAAFLNTLGWPVFGMTDAQADIALPREGQVHIEEGVDGLDRRIARIADNVALLQQDRRLPARPGDHVMARRSGEDVRIGAKGGRCVSIVGAERGKRFTRASRL